MIRAVVALCFAGLSSAYGQDTSSRFYQAIRNHSAPELHALIKAGDVAAPDKRGATPLMYAAAYGTLETMALLIEAGADVNAKNAFDATALMWCATDLEKVKLLLSKGADVNARSKQGRTPLLIASGTEGASAIVRLLLDKGADLKKADANPVTTPLIAAALANDSAMIELLIERGAQVRGPSGANAMMNASANGNVPAMRALMARGADVNSVSPAVLATVKNGPIALGLFTPLILAAAHGGHDAVKLLVDSKANVNAQDVRGMTPLMLALATDRPDARVVKLLIASGADASIKSKDGEIAADWARKFNHPDVLRELKVSPMAFKAAVHSTSPMSARPAVEKSVALLQRAASSFFVEGGCASCHSHNLVAMTLDVVRPLGIHVDEAAAASQSQQSRAFWMPQDQTLPLRMDPPGGADMLQYGLFQFAAERAKPTTYTDAMVHSLAAMQQLDGSWRAVGVARPPMEDGDFARTAMGVRAIQLYGSAGRKAEWIGRIARAATWLDRSKPHDSEDFNMQLMGLKWAGAEPRVIDRLVNQLTAAQRPDGGWAQTPYLASDSYATGQTLYALREVGIPATHAAYRKGVAFLLNTQLADGSWHVRSRAPKFQPYFQGGFPHDHDQWISMAGTAWATMAIAHSLEPPRKTVAAR